MKSQLDELRERIAKLPESDRYLLIELMLSDIRTHREKVRREQEEAFKADIELIRAEEATRQHDSKSRRRRATRAAG